MGARLLISICMLVVLTFLLQPIATSYVSRDNTSYDTNPELIDEGDGNTIISEYDKGSDEGERIRIREQEPLDYRAQLELNLKRMRDADPNVFIPEYELDKIIMKESDLAEMGPGEIFDLIKPKEVRFGLAEDEGGRTGTRAAAADLELTQMEWESAVNDGWGSHTETTGSPGNQPAYGGFMLGVATTITVSVLNHNPAVPIVNANINFSIYDYYSGMPLIKIPAQKQFSMTGQTTDVTFDYTPTTACIMYIGAYIDFKEDTDTLNNGIGWSGMRVLMWSSDFESTGFGDGSQTPNTWTGDVGTNDNEWHKTTSAQNQNNPDHTKPTSWFHGDESGATDTYDDSLTLHLESPVINMGDVSDGQEELGILRDNYYYIPCVQYWGGMYTGAGATGGTSDILYAYEYTDDGGVNWKSQYTPTAGSGIISGNWGTQNGGQPPGWYAHIFPFARMVGDGSGGNQPSNGAKNWTRVQFRVTFEGDNGGTTSGFPGFYADDFIVWGFQHYLTPYDVHLKDLTHLTQESQSKDIPIIYPNVGVPAKFETTVDNHGDTLSDIPVTVDIKKGTNDKSAPSVSGWPQTQYISSLDLRDEAVVSWEWTPSDEGDFHILIETGDMGQEYIKTNNNDELKVYVRKPNARILVVDDDNSANSGGIFYRDVEDKMLDALDALGISYNVYNVDWNETGPSRDIMNNYEAVFWLTGLDNEYDNFRKHPNWALNWGITLKPEDQTEIAAYLDQDKGNLWLISTGVLYDLTNSDSAKTPSGFIRDYLHVTYCNANESTPDSLAGFDNSLAGSKNYATLASNIPTFFSDRGGIIDPDTSSTPVFYQNPGKTSYNAIQYSGNYNMVFFAYNFYLMTNPLERNDLVYRVMNFFGLEGGLDLDIVDMDERSVSFGETASFKFKVVNPGKITDTINLKLETPSPTNVPAGWTVRLNDKMPDASINEITVAGDSGERYFYLNVTAPPSYLDSDGDFDPAISNTSAGNVIQFKIRAESAKYPTKFFDLASCKVTLDLVGNVKLTIDENTGSIDISRNVFLEDNYVEFTIKLRNETNGDENYNVMVTLDNPTPLTARVEQFDNDVTDDTVPLIPRMDTELSVMVYIDDHDLAGDYTMTFKVKDATGTKELNSTQVTVTVEQYYNIKLIAESDLVYSRLVDPNQITGDVEKLEFEITLENHGNGPDTVTLDWEECDDSPDAVPYAWSDDLMSIFEKGELDDTIDEIVVPAYDKVTGTPGSVKLMVEVEIPADDEEGRYWIDIKADSDVSKNYISNLVREDFEYKTNFTFQVQTILPKLSIDIANTDLLLAADDTPITSNMEIFEKKDEIKIKAAVINSGTAAVEDVILKLTITLDGPVYDTKTTNISIDLDETVYHTWTFMPQTKGVYTMKVEIDPQQTLIGDPKIDNSWQKTVNVIEEEEVIIEKPIIPGVEGGSNLTLIIVLIVIIIIVTVLILLFFFKLRKKEEDEDEFDDLDSYGAQLRARSSMGMGGMQQQAPAMPQAPSRDLGALAPSDAKQLPPGKPASGGNTCPNCGEKNPAENKFCQSCGGKIT